MSGNVFRELETKSDRETEEKKPLGFKKYFKFVTFSEKSLSKLKIIVKLEEYL